MKITSEELENGYWVRVTPIMRYKIASWLIRVWGINNPHLEECFVMLQNRINHYNLSGSRGAETRRGTKYKKRIRS